MTSGALDRVLTYALGVRIGVYNGVAARDRGVLEPDHEPGHKRALAQAALRESEPGDAVAFVGGGRCVAPVKAAREGRDVTVYEAGAEAYGVAMSAACLNDVDMELVFAAVGEPGEVSGSTADRRVDPSSIDCDLLVLDCEGAEADVLPRAPPGRVVVETHPEHGAATGDVVDVLADAEVVAENPIDGHVVVGRAE